MNTKNLAVGLVLALGLAFAPTTNAAVWGDPCDEALDKLENAIINEDSDLGAAIANADENCKQYRQTSLAFSAQLASEPSVPCADSSLYVRDVPVVMEIVVGPLHDKTTGDRGLARIEQKSNGNVLPVGDVPMLDYQKFYGVDGIEAGEDVWDAKLGAVTDPTSHTGIIYVRGAPLPASWSHVGVGCGKVNGDVCWGEATSKYVGAFSVTVTSSFNACI